MLSSDDQNDQPGHVIVVALLSAGDQGYVEAPPVEEETLLGPEFS